jgi:hypothetical protein
MRSATPNTAWGDVVGRKSIISPPLGNVPNQAALGSLRSQTVRVDGREHCLALLLVEGFSVANLTETSADFFQKLRAE